jgi:hypothetical protein
MKKTVSIILSLFFAASVAGAEKFKPSPTFLRGQSEINIVFDFSNTTFDGDSQGRQYRDKGSAWVAEWEGARRTDFINSLVSSLNKELRKVYIEVGNFPEAEYTFIVEVLDCDFGAYAGPFTAGAEVKCCISILKTGTAEVLSKVTLKEAQNPHSTVGTPIDFDRMFLAFDEMGEEVGEILVKALK